MTVTTASSCVADDWVLPCEDQYKVQVSNIIILRVQPVPAVPFQGEVMLNLLLLHFLKANHIPPPFRVCNRLFKIDVLFQTAATLCLLGTSLLCFRNSSQCRSIRPQFSTSPYLQRQFVVFLLLLRRFKTRHSIASSKCSREVYIITLHFA